MSQTLISSIHRALGVPDGRRDLLAPLAAVLASPVGPARETAIAGLAETLNSGASPGALVEQLSAQSTVLNPFRYERGSAWPYGTHASRRALVEELWSRGAAESNATLARAGFLLAAEGGFPYGVAALALLLRDPAGVESVTRWGAAGVAAVRTLLDEQRLKTRSFVAAAKDAAVAIETMIGNPSEMDDAQVLLLLAAAERLAQVAAGREDVQMRCANIVWRVANLAGSRQRLDVVEQLRATAAQWRARVADPHFARWLDEALHAPPREIRTAGVRRGTRAELGIRTDP